MATALKNRAGVESAARDPGEKQRERKGFMQRVNEWIEKATALIEEHEEDK